MEDKAAASPCDLPTTVLGLRPSPASSSSMHRLLHLCWGEIAQFSNFMVLRPLVMVLILKISPSSTSFPACVASHGGRGSNGSSSNTVLNAAMATCDIHHVAEYMLLSLSVVDEDVPQILACLLGRFILTDVAGNHRSLYS
ncbi:Dynamin family [Musa troglodytarum]|uniref:Dynamin family n=1 Tax=Musa troglodytarum TaxID=320322 RepID=A0A9E7FWT8_9LILI|nr:Dynamin family [Musa troglodytarum]